jgi:catechol 2,3-dioxygenase-like lactoylglutathione lyase family enzyme
VHLLAQLRVKEARLHLRQLHWRACEKAHQASCSVNEASSVNNKGDQVAALPSRGLSVACKRKKFVAETRRAEFCFQTFHASPTKIRECGVKYEMSVQVYGCNHVAIEVDDIKKAVAFYQDVFNLEKLDRGEGDAFFKLGEHQFLAIFEVEKVQPANVRHFGIMVRDEQQLAEVRKKLTGKYKLKLEPPFRCDFRDPWGNRIQVVDLHDESLIWLLPYREVQKAGVKFTE